MRFEASLIVRRQSCNRNVAVSDMRMQKVKPSLQVPQFCHVAKPGNAPELLQMRLHVATPLRSLLLKHAQESIGNVRVSLLRCRNQCSPLCSETRKEYQQESVRCRADSRRQEREGRSGCRRRSVALCRLLRSCHGFKAPLKHHAEQDCLTSSAVTL